MTIKPKKQYIIGNPQWVAWWEFYITAADDVLAFAISLPFVASHHKGVGNSVILLIDERYDVEEAWLATVEAIDDFLANKVELDPDVWEQW